MIAFIVKPMSPYAGVSSRSVFSHDNRTQVKASITPEKDLDITSVGNLCLDIILPISSYPVNEGHHQRLTSGARLEVGGSLNALVSAKRLGARVAHVAYISPQNQHTKPSDRALSAFVLDAASRLGLDTSCMLPRQGDVIPTCVALSDPHGRHTFLASNEFPEDNPMQHEQCAPDLMLKAVTRSKAHIVDGYALHSDRSLVRETVNAALASGTELWVDPQAATASLLRTGDDLFSYIMDHASGISLTAEEAFLLTNQNDALLAVRTMAEKSCPSVTTFLLKDGAQGSHIAWKHPGGNFELSSIKGFSVDVEDTIGAGDSFLGAFLAGRFVHKLSMHDSGMLANAMGAATCRNQGAGEFGVGALTDVIALLEGTSLAERVRTLNTEAAV